MKITAEFNDLEEMKIFIRNFDKGETPSPVAQPVTPVTPPQPTAPVMPPQPAAPIQAPVATAPAAVPTAATTYTQDEIQRAAVTLMDAGKQNELLMLLTSFGVEAVPQIPKERYGEFATALRQMGAQI